MRICKRKKAITSLKNIKELQHFSKPRRLRDRYGPEVPSLQCLKSAKLMNKIIRKTNNLKRKAQACKAHTACV